MRSWIDEVEKLGELARISGFLRSLRAKLAYAEEVRAQHERDSLSSRTAIIQRMAETIEHAAAEAVREVSETTAEMARYCCPSIPTGGRCC